MKRFDNLGSVVIGGILVALVAVGAIGSGWPDLSGPHEGLCSQGTALRKAGLLERARVLYTKTESEGNSCGAGQVTPLHEVEGGLRESERLTGLATARSAAGQPAAIDAYISALASYPFARAARSGLASELEKHPSKSKLPARRFCEFGSDLAEAGQLAQAHTAASRGLKKAPAPCKKALKMVSRRSARARRAAGAAEIRSREGRTAAARADYATALAHDAELAGARASLEGSIDEESRLDAAGTWLGGIPATLKASLSWVVPLAVALLVLAIALWILVREGSARIRPVRRLFELLGRRLAFFHDAALPEVSVDPFKGGGDSSGEDFSNLLSAAMSTQAGREPRFPFDRVNRGSKRDTSFAETVSAALKEVSETKMLGSLIEILGKLFRRRSIVLRGRLIDSSDEGIGVHLTMEGNGQRLSADATLWEKVFDPLPGGDSSARYLRLVPAATVWARWQLASAYELPKQIEVEDWWPDALFQTGLACQARRDFGRAEFLYTQALERDPTLFPAAHNLASIEIRRGEYRLARQRISRLRKEDLGKWPLLGTASLYSLVLAIAYPRIVAENESRQPLPSLGDGPERSRQLILDLADLITAGPSETVNRENITELEAAEMPSVVLRASLLLRADPTKADQAAAEAAADDDGVEPLTREQLRAQVNDLEPWDLVRRYVEQQPFLSRRAHYNLACYYTVAGRHAGAGGEQCYERARKALKCALVSGELAQWAREDPALTRLREAGPAKFEAVLASHPIEPHDEPDAGGGAAAQAGPEAPDGHPAEAANGEVRRWLEGAVRFGQALLSPPDGG